MKRINDVGLFEIFEAKGLHLVAFTSRFSTACGHFLPEFRWLDEVMTDIRCLTIDMDDNPAITEFQEVMAAPTCILYKDGKAIGRWEGPYSHEALQARITELLAKKEGT